MSCLVVAITSVPSHAVIKLNCTLHIRVTAGDMVYPALLGIVTVLTNSTKFYKGMCTHVID